MKQMRRSASIVVLGVLAVFLLPSITTASNLAFINGNVRDSSGIPLAGALVVISAASPAIPERMAFTDSRGSFSIPNLFAGEYSIKVTMPQFLPALKHGIQLRAGGTAILTVNLQNALDIVRKARDKNHSEDIVWTLRSSRSSQPVLNLVEKSNTQPDQDKLADYSGYFQVYSKSVETSVGTSEGVGSQFSVTMPLVPGSQVTLAGQYSELPQQSRGFGALYEFSPSGRHRSSIGVNLRQGALLGDSLSPTYLKEVQVEYGEDLQWTDHLVFNYGAEIGRADAAADLNYLRPRFGISWVPQARTTLSVSATSQAPAAVDDPIRGKEYFDRSIYLSPALEHYSHGEIAASHVLSENTGLSFTAFRDRSFTQALFVTAPDGRRGLLILDTRNSPSNGVRVYLNRKLHSFEAGLGYAAATGLGLSSSTAKVDDLKKQLVRRRFHIVTARVKTDFDLTQTELTAVYRWISSFSTSRIDSYQNVAEYNDPTLSITIAQNLPTSRLFPGKIQAILDARNLFEQSFGSQRIQVAQYPRLVKGGINIKF